VYFKSERLVLSPSDLVAHLYCAHVTELSLEVAGGERAAPPTDDPQLTVVQERGIAHEEAYLESLREIGASVVEIPGTLDVAERALATLDALGAGPDVIYQATFFDDTGTGPAWRGHADFLNRVEGESDFGSFSYQPSDTKLARQVRPSAVIQLCEYAEQLARVQGTGPEQIHIVLGGRELVSLRLADFAAYFRATKRRFELAATNGAASYPLPNQHCGVCPWRGDCEARWLADDHLVRVAGLRLEQVRRFAVAGVGTVHELAGLQTTQVKGIGSDTVAKLRQQARLQLATEEVGGPPRFELLETAQPGIGLSALPEPSPGDLFFDIEGDPFVDDSGLEYLLGVGWIEPDGSFGFRAFWAHSRSAEKEAFEAFIDFVTERRASTPDLHVYHFAPYETAAVGRLMGRHGTREAEVDQLMRAGVFVDLYRVVRQGVRVGTPSYSLKKLEALYMEARTEAIIDAGSSIVEYERWLTTSDQGILDQIEEYNRVDCESTRKLRDWLEDRRFDYAEEFGAEPPRPEPRDGEPGEGVAAEGEEHAALRGDLAASSVATADGAYACWLLGELLEWHRREDKPDWWQYFHRVHDLEDDDLIEDTEAIGGLVYEGPGDRVKQSVIHRYRFDPEQEHKLSTGHEAFDPEVARQRAEGLKVPGPGTLEFIDPAAGLLGLKRGVNSTAAHPRSLIPGGPLPTNEQREALRRVAHSAIATGIDGAGPYRAVRDLLLRRPPRGAGLDPGTPVVHPGEDAAGAAVRVAAMLDSGNLAIHGPPGSGKTRTAADIAVALLGAGQRVGVTANSHAVINNLLQRIVEAAGRAGVAVSCSQKAEKGQGLDHPAVAVRGGNAEMEAALAAGDNLIAGTAWLFCRSGFDQSLDYLIVDEAGQVSLANAVAVGTCARNLVLVGDPRQLTQPLKGTHPDGVQTSALEHLLGGADTMPENLGIFLDRTYRLHPDICTFVSEVVYDGRLHTVPGCELQRITGEGELAGSGLRWVPVDHAGNRNTSPEEADVVRVLYEDLIGRTFVGKDRGEQGLRVDDILVVAPYNSQVSLLARSLPEGARVGTVDKFQGQEAAIVIVSLATSSLEEIPRGMEFLYSRNRLNVAVSRAMALSVVVASPTLLAVKCNTVEQLRLANGLCRLVELAQHLVP